MGQQSLGFPPSLDIKLRLSRLLREIVEACDSSAKRILEAVDHDNGGLPIKLGGFTVVLLCVPKETVFKQAAGILVQLGGASDARWLWSCYQQLMYFSMDLALNIHAKDTPDRYQHTLRELFGDFPALARDPAQQEQNEAVRAVCIAAEAREIAEQVRKLCKDYGLLATAPAPPKHWDIRMEQAFKPLPLSPDPPPLAPAGGDGDETTGDAPSLKPHKASTPPWDVPGLPESLKKLAGFLAGGDNGIREKADVKSERGRFPSEILADARKNWGDWVDKWIYYPRGKKERTIGLRAPEATTQEAHKTNTK